MRLPKSDAEKRATAAARQKRWRDNKAKKAQVAAAVDGSLGLGPVTPLPDLPDRRLSELVEERIRKVVSELDDESLMDRRFQAAIKTGLQAENIIDKRQVAKAKTGGAELAFALIKWLAGDEPAKQLGDGNTVEGEFVETE